MKPLQIDFISDLVCPWCVIGLYALQHAIEELKQETNQQFDAQIHFLPFELNPDAPPAGLEKFAHVAAKYGLSKAQVLVNQQNITQRGLELGFEFNMEKRSHYYNTFDGHRLMYWAQLSGQQLKLKQALFTAYFTEGKNLSDHKVLTEAAVSAGFDATEVSAFLVSDHCKTQVRAHQLQVRKWGIQSVPAMFINQQYLISGSQSVAAYKKALKDIANGTQV